MANKVAVKLDLDEIIGQLKTADKIKLVQRLEKETWAARWDRLLSKIDERVKKYPITDEKIDQEVREVRRERYERKKAKGSN